MELQPFLSSKDSELEEYIPKLMQISYDLMIRMYNIDNPDKAQKDLLKENLDDIYYSVFQDDDVGYLDLVFNDDSKLENA